MATLNDNEPPVSLRGTFVLYARNIQKSGGFALDALPIAGDWGVYLISHAIVEGLKAAPVQPAKLPNRGLRVFSVPKICSLRIAIFGDLKPDS
jgi:hypothetical protein